jgi:hypothetical protein
MPIIILPVLPTQAVAVVDNGIAVVALARLVVQAS